MDQRIPLGTGRSPHAVRRHRRFARFRRPGAWSALAAGLGLTASLAGVLLAATAEPRVEVGLEGGTYRIGGQELQARGGGVYEGARGGAVVIRSEGGRVVAAGSSDLGGRHMTGRCVMDAGADREACSFTVSGRVVTAIDTRVPDGWHRRYSDGRTVAIRVTSGGQVPVPFAIGQISGSPLPGG